MLILRGEKNLIVFKNQNTHRLRCGWSGQRSKGVVMPRTIGHVYNMYTNYMHKLLNNKVKHNLFF